MVADGAGSAGSVSLLQTTCLPGSVDADVFLNRKRGGDDKEISQAHGRHIVWESWRILMETGCLLPSSGCYSALCVLHGLPLQSID